MFVLESQTKQTESVMKKLVIMFLLATNTLFSQDKFNTELIERMNELRASVGVGSLTYNPVLDSLAQAWSQYILDSLDKYTFQELSEIYKNNKSSLHVNVRNRTYETNNINNISIEKFGKYKLYEPIMDENLIITENYILNPETLINKCFNGWYSSKGHYKTMVEELYNSCGFAYAYNPKKKRYTFLVVFAEIKK